MNSNTSNKKTLVLGVSLKPDRYSNRVIHRLSDKNIPTIGIGLKKGKVAAIEIYQERKTFRDIHTLSLYINPKSQKDYYDYILSLKPKRVIFNPGTENTELMSILDAKNIEYKIACTLTLLALNQY